MEVKQYALEYTDRDGGGYSFDCDSQGNLLPGEDLKFKAHAEDINSREWYYDGVVQEYVHTVVEPMVLECDCGERLFISDTDEVCECGRWYNSFGQELRDPKYWDWEGI